MGDILTMLVVSVHQMFIKCSSNVKYHDWWLTFVNISIFEAYWWLTFVVNGGYFDDVGG